MRAEVMACEKKMSCVTMYTRICGQQQQLGKWLCVAGSQPTWKNFCCKIYSRKIFSYVFLVRKYFHNEIKANYGMSQLLGIALRSTSEMIHHHGASLSKQQTTDLLTM